MAKFEWQKKAPFAKPCPFCGCKNVITEKKEHFYSLSNKSCTYIECAKCGAQIYGEAFLNDATYNECLHSALKSWNRRAVTA